MRLPDTDPSKETLVLFAQTQEIKQELTNLKNLKTMKKILRKSGRLHICTESIYQLRNF